MRLLVLAVVAGAEDPSPPRDGVHVDKWPDGKKLEAHDRNGTAEE